MPRISCAARSTASLAAWLASSVPATRATPSATPMIVSAERSRRAVRPRQARVAEAHALEAQRGEAGDQRARLVVGAAAERDLVADRRRRARPAPDRRRRPPARRASPARSSGQAARTSPTAGPGSRCRSRSRGCRSAHRPGGSPARWPGPAPGPPAAARRRRAGPADGSPCRPGPPARAARRRARGASPASRRRSGTGSATFSATLSSGIRLKNWKTKPVLARRVSVACSSSSWLMLMPSMTTCRWSDGRGRPAGGASSTCRSPTTPMIATNSPCSTESETPCSTSTEPAPADSA